MDKERNAEMVNKAEMRINIECNGIEIYFDERPDDEILEELHSYKWRWHKKKRCWYNYDSSMNREIAEQICDEYNQDQCFEYSGSYLTGAVQQTYSGNEFDPSEWDEESLLMKNGYTVSQEEGLSSTERQRILTMVIRNRIMTPSQIIDHIERMINLRDGQSKYDIACSKWREDIRFVMKCSRGM